MSDFSRRTVVRGAAWTIPVVAIAANAPAYAASTDAPTPGGFVVTCRTNGNGQDGSCQGYRVILTFVVNNTFDWNIRILSAQIVGDSGATGAIKQPVSFPQLVSAVKPTLNLWYCSSSSPSNLKLAISYTTWRSDASESTATTNTFPQQTYGGGAIAAC